MAISLQLAAMRDLLRTETGQAVFIGRPDQDVPGLYLWPWKLDLQANLSNRPPIGQRDCLRDKKSELPLRIRLLVIPIAASGIESCDFLAAALRAINDHPALVAAEARGQVRTDTMSTDELATIFTAAGLSLTLCLACTLETIV